MKLVREHIDEKFTEEGDPIKNMGIGTREYLKREYKKLVLTGGMWNIYDLYFRSIYGDSNEGYSRYVVRIMIHTLRKIIERNMKPQVAFEKTCKEEYEKDNLDSSDISKIREITADFLNKKYHLDIDPEFRHKKRVNEKFTEEGDPLKDLGIGVKYVYYRLYKSDQNFYTMYISGDSYNVRDILKKYKFKWDDINYAWKSKFSMPKESWEINAPIMFKEIEKIGGHVVQPKGKLTKFDKDMERSFFIEGYDHWEYPFIPAGNGAKVYFKQWHHHAPVIGVMGKGSYLGRAVLKYDGYQFTQGSHMWERTYDREDVDDLIKYFKECGYTVIDGRKKVNEKFEEESDPIRDMRIGMHTFFKKEADRLLHLKYDELRKEFNINDYNIDDEDSKLFICVVAVSMLGTLANKETVPNAFHDAYNYWKRNFSDKNYPGPYFTKIKLVQILKDKYGIEWDAQKIYEKFEEESDPIDDMGIGIPLLNLFKRMHQLAQNAEKAGSFSKVSEINWNTGSFSEFIGPDLLGSFSIDSNHRTYYRERDDQGRKTRRWAKQNEQFKIFLVQRSEGDYYIQVYNVLGNKSEFPKTAAGFLMHTKAVKSVNEKFTPESDPIEDMGIGAKEILKTYNVKSLIGGALWFSDVVFNNIKNRFFKRPLEEVYFLGDDHSINKSFDYQDRLTNQITLGKELKHHETILHKSKFRGLIRKSYIRYKFYDTEVGKILRISQDNFSNKYYFGDINAAVNLQVDKVEQLRSFILIRSFINTGQRVWK